MDATQRGKLLAQAMARIAERCPRLARGCYWADTAAIAIEDLGHRESYDLDFHTRRALQDTRPFLAEIEQGFPGGFEVLQAPDELGSGFSGLLALPETEQPVPVQVLSNYEDVPEADLTASRCAPAWDRVTLARYLADKIRCVVERTEARDPRGPGGLPRRGSRGGPPDARSSVELAPRTGRPMKRTYRFARPTGFVVCRLEDEAEIRLPVFQGILRHLARDELARLLGDPAVARKYTREALRKAAWPVLREFPPAWLVACLEGLDLRPGRRRALEFLLGLEPGGFTASSP